MRSTTSLLVGALAAYASAATNPGEPSPQSSSQSVVQTCIGTCDASDVDCLSHCTAVPNPTTDQVNATNRCYTGCYDSLSSGALKSVDELSACTEKCIHDNYYVVDSGTPRASGSNAGSSGGSSGGSNANPSGGTKPGPSSVAPSQQSGSPSSTASTGATGTGSGTATASASASATRGASNAGASNPPNNNGAASMVNVAGPALGFFGLVAAFLAV